MSLLTICQDAADEVGINKPSAIAGVASNEDARKLFRLANKIGNRLMKNFVWKELTEEQTYTAVAGSEQTSILPSDFDRFVPETMWDRTNDIHIVGPIKAVEWQGYQAVSNTSVARKFYHRGSSIYMASDMDGGESLAFEYVTKNWAEDSSGTDQAKFEADTDTAKLDEELITLGVVYEYLKSKGLPTGEARHDYIKYFRTLRGNDKPSGGVIPAGDIFGGRGYAEGNRRFGGAPFASRSGGLF